jgi:hypothetical protein
MKPSGIGLLPVVLAVVLLVAATVVQGVLTDRWASGDVAEELVKAAASLQQNFPQSFGDWEAEKDLETDSRQMDRAGAVGHISRLYRNKTTGAQISTFVVCATPHDASGHTPDRCYPGAGFEIAEQEHRQSVPLADGRVAETFTGTFSKKDQTLRIFWTYGVDGEWVAPQIARIELAGKPAVNKLYAIVDETGDSDGRGMAACVDFLAELLPAFDQQVVAAAAAAPQAEAPAENAEAATEASESESAAVGGGGSTRG